MNFRHDINALRCLAVLIVVLYHFEVPGFKFGFIGVDLFFVVSGFLMTQIISKAIAEKSFSFISFMYRRAKRIVPALFFMILVTTIVAWQLMLPNELKTYSAHAITSGLFLSNEYYAVNFGYFDSAPFTKWLLHTWSLSVEWQFYLVLPIALITISKFKIKKLLIPAIFLFSLSFVVSTYYYFSHDSRLYYGLESRAWELLAGSVFYYLYDSSKTDFFKGKKTGAALLILLLISLPLASSLGGWPNPISALPVVLTGCILFNSNQQKIFQTTAVKCLGLWSYSIYLWHWPVFVVIKYVANLTWYLSLLGIVLSVILGAFSFYFIEQRLTSKLLGTRGVHLNSFKLASVCAPLLIFLLTIHYTNGAESRFTEKSREALNVWTSSLHAQDSCIAYGENLDNTCLLQGNNDKITLIVYGDSHAASLKNTFHNLNKKNGSTLVFSAKGCPFLTNMTVKNVENPKECSEWNQRVSRYISSHHPYVPVVLVNRISAYIHNQSDLSRVTVKGPLISINGIDSNRASTEYVQTFMDIFFDNVSNLSKTNPIFFVKPIPEFGYNIPKKMARLLNSNEHTSENNSELVISINEYRERNEAVLYELKNRRLPDNFYLVDSTQALCNRKFCFGTKNSFPIYYDSDHLTEKGSDLLIPVFEDVEKVYLNSLEKSGRFTWAR